MSKHYKFQNSTIMYLNSSFNCIKSNSINLTTKTAGTGYTSAPTIKITPVANDNGYGATATCTVSGGLITAVTVTNNGKEYNSLPTVTISGGGGTGGAFNVLFLKTFSYTWNGIPPVIINDLARLSTINIMATGFVTSTPYTFRISGVQYDSRDSFFSDYGLPILSMAQNINICSHGSLGSDLFSIILTPQTINSITITVDDDITKKDIGQLAAINFVIAIEIQEFDPTMTEIGDVYAESASRIKNGY
jgi:hypothetical protein